MYCLACNGVWTIGLDPSPLPLYMSFRENNYPTHRQIVFKLVPQPSTLIVLVFRLWPSPGPMIILQTKIKLIGANMWEISTFYVLVPQTPK